MKIINEEELKKKIKIFKNQGLNKVHIVSDFDKTLTTNLVNGKKVPSIISVLRDGSYLTSDYAEKAQKLYNKYHPIEIDHKLSIEARKKAMNEWWTEHFKLLIKSKLNKKDIKKVVESGKVKLRGGISEFLAFLHNNNIPLIIISGNGLGGDSISMFLEKEGKLYSNIHIVSNSFEFDEKGNAVAVKEPIIHGMNKDETILHNLPFFNEIKHRKNIILLGDSLGDPDMVTGFNYENIINSLLKQITPK
ncbi:hypothetical protein J4413_01960 [Candidatus Woesearchaeota archaeon]|nr:hypothetical protein [Candidatus Woesearchaeota archaeon]